MGDFSGWPTLLLRNIHNQLFVHIATNIDMPWAFMYSLSMTLTIDMIPPAETTILFHWSLHDVFDAHSI